MYEQQLAPDHVYFLDNNNIEEQKWKKRFGSKAMTLTVGGTRKKKKLCFFPPFPGKQSNTKNI